MRSKFASPSAIWTKSRTKCLRTLRQLDALGTALENRLADFLIAYVSSLDARVDAEDIAFIRQNFFLETLHIATDGSFEASCHSGLIEYTMHVDANCVPQEIQLIGWA